MTSGPSVYTTAPPAEHHVALEELAGRIVQDAYAISRFLRSNSYPQPSFERDAPATTLPATSPPDIRAARASLIEASRKMFQLATGPSEFLSLEWGNVQYTACLRWLSRFKIFQAVPLQGSIAYSELASAVKVPEETLKSVARMAMTGGLFVEPTYTTIAHSATSALVMTDENVAATARWMADIHIPVASKFSEATEKWPGSVNKTETAFNLAFDTDLPFFSYISCDKEKSALFARYMNFVSTQEPNSLKHVVSGFDWASLGKGVVVDVGGSTGHASVAIAEAFPDLEFVVQDLPATVARGPAAVSSLRDNVRSRITFQAHDFLQPQTIKEASAYFLRVVLHDWPDADVIKILKNLVDVLGSNSRILIMDLVMPVAGSVPAMQERFLRMRDITMQQNFNSGERDIQDWTRLVAATNDRLAIVNVVQPVGSAMSVIEVKLKPSS